MASGWIRVDLGEFRWFQISSKMLFTNEALMWILSICVHSIELQNNSLLLTLINYTYLQNKRMRFYESIYEFREIRYCFYLREI